MVGGSEILDGYAMNRLYRICSVITVGYSRYAKSGCIVGYDAEIWGRDAWSSMLQITLTVCGTRTQVLTRLQRFTQRAQFEVCTEWIYVIRHLVFSPLNNSLHGAKSLEVASDRSYRSVN